MTVRTSQTAASRLIADVEARRVRHAPASGPGRLGQVFTPMPVAAVLAAMFDVPDGPTRLLDPGAGVGSLTAAVAARAAAEQWAAELDVTAVEVDGGLVEPLRATLAACAREMPLTATVAAADFVEWGSAQLQQDADADRFDLAILNPPYAKLDAGSTQATSLTQAGVAVPNLYAAFVVLSLRLLAPGGQLVAVIPRSFCNGPYFRTFRTELLDTAALRQVHVFDKRDQTFRDSGVLQETVVVHLVKEQAQGDVAVTSSSGDGHGPVCTRRVPFSDVVHPDDPDRFVRLVTSDADADAASKVRSLTNDLERLGVSVSTGRVVGFRVRQYLRSRPGPGTVPLIHPLHLRDGRVRWPASSRGRKPNALVAHPAIRKLLLPAGNYVLVKRFTSKEQPRRVVASVLATDDLPYRSVGIENHINVYHQAGGSLPAELAWGIAAYLNSTTVDTYFRQFNGHTQVNATDLRSLRYPTTDQLHDLGSHMVHADRTQAAIDAAVVRHVGELGG